MPIAEPSGLEWLSGFDELLCRCGLESDGAPDFDERGQLTYALTERIANLPAYELKLRIDDSAGTNALQGIVEESRFHSLQLRLSTTYPTHFGSNRVGWHDEVENFGGTNSEMQMLSHTNIGQAHLEAGSRFVPTVSSVGPGNADTAAMGTRNGGLSSPPNSNFWQQV